MYISQQHVLYSAILLYVLLIVAVTWMRPAFVYNSDGSLRTFGVGYARKTIVPMWLLSLLLGIFCYIFVQYVVRYDWISLD